MDIKEIALKHSREYLTFKLGGRKGLDVAEIVCDDEIYAEIVDELAQQFESIIESYKAELLNEAGEPVLYAEFAEDGGWLGDASEYADHLEEPHALFTSDQVAAAILKATKPLGDKLAAAQEENERPPAIDAYETYIADDKESDPVERLRFFLSLALKGKDWLDVERFIKDVSDQFYKVEQRVAEACALQVATETKFHWLDAARVAKEIRSGEWRKFMKEK